MIILIKNEDGNQMAKLYFKYGAMGSSKSAQALMCKYNYEQKGFQVLLLKPGVDTRGDSETRKFVTSRIGLSAPCTTFSKEQNLEELILPKIEKGTQVIVVDEAQFCTSLQVEQLKEIANKVPVLCYGLKNNFKSQLFEGSKRLVEIADSLSEIKSVCRCGRKATVNARFVNGKVVTDGAEVLIGGDESYESMCYTCWKKAQNEK